MKYRMSFCSSLILLGLTLGANIRGHGQETATYTVTFKGSWTEKTHPFEYPESGLLSGPHFSGLIGASHGSAYSLFGEGSLPTPGLERLSEEGKHSPLDEEIKSAMSAGKTGALFETGPIKDFTKSETTEVQVSSRNPMVSAVAMIAPSPDWFAGVANVNLMENGKWVQTRTVELLPWDSGGDDGASYEASDMDTTPKKPTTKATTRHFVMDGKTIPVGTLTFTLKK